MSKPTPFEVAAVPHRPRGNSNFLVDLGGGVDPCAPEAGFCEVVFPEFCLGAAAEPSGQAVVAPHARHLVLRRAATGALDLYRWWVQARDAKAPPRRTVTIELLAEDAATTVMRWRFQHAYPVALAYSPLRAQEGGLVFETVALDFAKVEMG